ncbi:CoA pyrophosphatase [Phenylobacterium sp.]|uniref:CoA pyrophosphatase n=1 Tax=Phenylobacterium sp. TaxID=1871053 RepID=UPI0039C926C7
MRGSLPELRAWMGQRLDPLDDAEPSDAMNSDFDLNQNWRPADPAAPLTLAAVLVPLVERAEGVTVLLTRRSDSLRNHTGQIALPGGRRDPGETLWQTALREAEEEIGLDRGFVDLVGLSSPYRTGSNYLVTPVVGFVRPGFTLTPNPGEVADIFETPFGYLMDPDNYEQHEWTNPQGATRRFYATTHEDRYIWGATAGMLRALYERLYGSAVA